ncbi:trace amine-associated receptor 8c-like [Anneissia japonica]|uniref:trace amine-associated receptor 8c-like n=1 Tax=Anneissia japonica TaxID=1529436 RepID=UPI0014255FD0|nr:trace amine-associated receptor 8c-like [Anneissia japonica]
MDEFAINTRNSTNEIRNSLIFVSTVYIPLDFVIICGNAFVLMVIHRTPSLQQPQFTLLASLALVDLLTGIIGVPTFVWGLVVRGSLLLQNVVDCQLQYIPVKFFVSASFLHLIFITADRYVAIIKPLRYGQIITQTRIYCAIVFSWILAGLYASVQVFWKTKRIEGIFLCYQMNPQGFEVQRRLILIIIPTGVVILIIMYFRIFMEARKHRNAIAAAQNAFDTQTSAHKKFKAAKTSALMVCLFAVAYVPYSVRVVIFLFGFERSDIYWYELMSEVLLCSSSAINPFIYVFRHRQFSSALRRLMKNYVNRD